MIRDIPIHNHSHSLYVRCLSCKMFGINTPTRFVEASECGSCGSMETVKYYPSCCILSARDVLTRQLECAVAELNHMGSMLTLADIERIGAE